MMDCDRNKDNDIIIEKLNQTIENSNKLLHKKAIVLVRGMKEQIGDKGTQGLEGIKNYIKKVLSLIDILFSKLSNIKGCQDTNLIEEDVRNSEALIFTLAVCVKQLPYQLLRNIQICEKIIESVEKMVKISSIKIGRKLEIKKYVMIIAEKLLSTRSEAEMQNESDIVLRFFSHIFFTFLEESSIQSDEEIQKAIIKSISKLLKTPNMVNVLKLTLLLQIKNFLINKIRGMNIGKDYETSSEVNSITINFQNENKIKQITTSEGEAVLKFLCSILQFLPFELVNDLILELTDLIVGSENKHILLNALLCFEVAFNTKTFALETSEKILKMLLNKDFIMNANEEEVVEKLGVDINTSLTIAFMKSTTQVLLNLAKVNILAAIKYLTSVISLLGEFLASSDSFLKNSVFNSLQSLFSHILNKKNMNILFTKLHQKRSEVSMDPNELTLDINLTSNNAKSDSNIVSVLENISQNLIYLTSDRFDDLKPGFNLLYNFLEQITTWMDNESNTNPASDQILQIVDQILSKMAENEKVQTSQTFKVFIGKLFNLVNASLLLRAFPLYILDFDICSEDYTDNSKVWIISYIDKFLRNDGVQNLREYYENFFPVIEELERVIYKLKMSKVKSQEKMLLECDKNEATIEAVNDEMQLEEEDEKFDVNQEESLHIRNIKIKRYELILQQVWSLAIKFSNWNPNYDAYILEFIKKFEVTFNTYNKEANSVNVYNIREIIFKIIGKMISNSFKFNDLKSLENIKKEGKKFFSKCLVGIVNQKVKGSELNESFNLISSFCKILSEKFLYKIICDMIDKFDKTIQNAFQANDNFSNCSNKAKLNESLNISLNNEDMNVDGAKANQVSKKNNFNVKKDKDREANLLCLRIEIINYILKNMKSFSAPSDSNSQSLFELLNTFFEKFFFNEKISSYPTIRKKLIDLFILILNKIEQQEQIIDIFTKFVNEYKGLELLSTKQKAKLFEFIIEKLIKKFHASVDISECIAQMHILIEIVSLTKDMNRKVRNLAYDMIGQITDFMSSSNLFDEWIKMILALLASNSSFIKSASINALARIFWQKRNSITHSDGQVNKLLNDTSEVVLLLLKDNNKELTKSIFLFIRVLLYLNKNVLNHVNTSITLQKIINSIFKEMSEDVKKEFKVKIRNLLKNLIMKFSYEEIKFLVPNDVQNLLSYINKHVVKKIKNATKEEESLYEPGSLDDSVMMDNDENLLDEEEDYIQKEFHKIDKKKNEQEKFLARLDKLNLEEDDPELVKKQEEADKNVDEKMDKIEQLFKKDNIELENFFYVNPYAYLNSQANKEKNKEAAEKEKDVFYDKKKGKLIVKDLLGGKKSNPKPKLVPGPGEKNNLFTAPMDKDERLLNKKRVQNVLKDEDDSDEEDNRITNRNMKVSKRKITHSKEKVSVSSKPDKFKKKSSHFLKFSGDEYQNKAGKGDKLLQGKYDPFAYIQLNPKATSIKTRKENLKLFENVMHPEKHK